jgi:hypothetical protein
MLQASASVTSDLKISSGGFEITLCSSKYFNLIERATVSLRKEAILEFRMYSHCVSLILSTFHTPYRVLDSPVLVDV